MPLRHRQHRVALVPLDDRPSCTKVPRLLAQMVDYEVLLPPAEAVGHGDEPGDSDLLADWLLGVAGEVDCIICSLDTLTCGGLPAARAPRTHVETATQRLRVLRDLRAHQPAPALLAFGTIPGLAARPDWEHGGEEWRLVHRYAELSATKAASEERSRLEASIPADLLADYLAVRQRSQRVNLAAIEAARDGALDILLIGQDRAAPSGIHRREQAELQTALRKARLGARGAIVAGRDELGALLLARFVHQHMESVPDVAVVYSEPAQAEAVAPLDDRPLRDSVAEHVRAIGARLVTNPDRADVCLFVNTPSPLPLDVCGPGGAQFDARCQALRAFVTELSGHVARDRVGSVADLGFPHGADEALMRCMHEIKVDLTRLAGFAAHADAGTAVGLALVHSCLRLIALRDKGAFDLAQALGDLKPLRYLELLNSLVESERAHLSFLFGRFVDDFLYQGRVRPRVAEKLAQVAAEGDVALEALPRLAESMVRAMLGRAAGEFYIEHFLGRQAVAIGRYPDQAGLMLCELEETRIRLPGQRLAEVDLDFQFGVQIVAGAEPDEMSDPGAC